MNEPSKVDRLRERFAELHRGGIFVMPNAWDVGSARIFQSLGFEAIATTSAGFAATLGRQDQRVQLNELAVHVADLCEAVDIPVSVDSESGYSADVPGLADTVALLAAAGAAGISLEDHIPGRGIIDKSEAVERVAAAVEAAAPRGVVVTARADNHFYGSEDVDDTISRLQAYSEAGADVLYAPWVTPSAVGRLVASVDKPVNVLIRPGIPSVPELADLGVRRVSTGAALSFLAYGAAARAATQLLEEGSADLFTTGMTREERDLAFGG
jgi:2-methylisocitrate lyase-like PEP mutase family enzyme